MMVPQRKTRDGFEEHFGLNYLGHFVLTNLLLDSLKEAGRPGRTARVVTVSSATHYVGELRMRDLHGRCAPAGSRAGGSRPAVGAGGRGRARGSGSASREPVHPSPAGGQCVPATLR